MNLTFKLHLTGTPIEYPFTAPTVNAGKQEAIRFLREHRFNKGMLLQFFPAYSEFKPVLSFELDDILPQPDNYLDYY